MPERGHSRLETGTLEQTAGRIAALLAAACPVALVFILHGPTAALWVAVAASAGLWAVADILARRGPTATVRVLRARKVELVSADDRVVVALGETVGGKGAVAVYDRNGSCIERFGRRERTTAKSERDTSSALGRRSPFAFGFGTETGLSAGSSGESSVENARRSSPKTRSKSTVQRRKRISAERRSQVLGAIELSCSFPPAQTRDDNPQGPSKNHS